jgi:hypothetical protein
VLKFFTDLDESLRERLQRQFPMAKFVKTFSSVGNARMVNPDFGGTRPTMFICGNDAAAKGTVVRILDQFGWETEDMGGVEAARASEPLCKLWCIPGFLRNQWTHAFKMLKGERRAGESDWPACRRYAAADRTQVAMRLGEGQCQFKCSPGISPTSLRPTW